jgi:transcription antitermination factor NusG
MPIITDTTTIFPEDLFEAMPPLSLERRWWVIYTKSRQEKALANQMFQAGLSFFLPLVPKDYLIRGRRVRSQIPLFAGYVFLFGSQDERVRALATNRVAYILPVEDGEQLWRDLSQIHRLIKTNSPLTIERRLAPGQRVRVKSGAMAGIEGTVTARRGTCRLLVAVNLLQQGVSVAIDDYMLEPLE